MAARGASSRHGVAAIERDTVIIGALTAVVSMADFMTWYNSAPVGAKTVYAQGPALPIGNELCAKINELTHAGFLFAWSTSGDRGKTYYARREKLDAPAVVSEAGADNLRREAAVAGTDAGRILDILKRSANFDRQVPSLADLAQLAGLPNRQRARYLKQSLEDKGLIEITRKQGCRQVVKIVSSGKSTRGGV